MALKYSRERGGWIYEKIDAEILRQAIKKSIDNGWEPAGFYPWIGHNDIFIGDDCKDELWTNIFDCKGVYDIIFNHDFARSLFGEEPITCDCDASGHGDFEYGRLPSWQVHLRSMVIAPDPIKYLGEHLPK